VIVVELHEEETATICNARNGVADEVGNSSADCHFQSLEDMLSTKVPEKQVTDDVAKRKSTLGWTSTED